MAYNAHDLDDGLQAGLIRSEQLQSLDIWRIVTGRLGWTGGALDEVDRHHVIRELVGMQVDDVLQNSAVNIETAQPRNSLDVQQQSQPLVSHSERQQGHNRDLKDFLYENMYRHYRILRMQTRAEHILQALFTGYMKEARQLPDDFRARLAKEETERVVADYIASLTDRSAFLEYRQFFDPKS